MTNKEIWLPIKNVQFYYISNMGNVKSIERTETKKNKNGTIFEYKRKGRILCVRDNGHGYVHTNLGRKNRAYIHRLVAEAFIENKENKPTVNHKNGIKSDNRAENLEWMTYSENQKHSKDSGLCKLGEDHPKSKLSNLDVIYIKENYHKGTKFLADKFKVGRPTICKIAHGNARKRG